jgi:hypothetical protein
MKFIISLFLSSLLLLPAATGFTQQAVTAKASNPPGRGLIIYDTIQAGWNEVSPGKISNASAAIRDNKGIIYAEVQLSPEERSYCYLQNGQWKRLEDEIKNNVYYLYSDANENVYAGTWKAGIYKKTGNQWKLIAGDSSAIYTITVQAGERFYGFRKQPGTTKLEMVRWEGKSWVTIESTAGKLEFDDLPDMAMDKKGQLYFATSDNKKARILQCLLGKELKEIGEMPMDIGGLGMDEDGILYVYGGVNKGFIKKWNGIAWSDIPLPGGITKYVYPNINYRAGKLHLTSLSDDPAVSRDERLYFMLQKGNWIKIASYNTRFSIYPPLESNGLFYAVNGRTQIMSRLETGRIIKREIYPFSFKDGLAQTNELNEILAKLWLVKEGNKYGVIGRNGETIIYPAIDQIKIDKDPHKSSSSGYAFALFVNGEDFYTPLGSAKLDPASLPGAFEEKSDKCKECKGKGRFDGGTKYETVPGEWVEATTTTSTRPSTMGGYEKTTITTPGYRKPSTIKPAGTYPGKTCSKCNGKGEFVKGWKEYLEYNAKTNSYRKQRKEYTN